MPRLHAVLRVLEHDLHEVVELEPHHRRGGDRWLGSGLRRRGEREAVPGEDASDVEVIR